MSKRILFMSDLHCGHVAGLCPPRWQIKGGSPHRDKIRDSQREAWQWYSRQVTRCGPYDVVVVNGDAIDGQGTRSGGTELITTDRNEQIAMAVFAIRRAITKGRTRVVMTYGTGYHVGNEEDFELGIANILDAKIGSHEWLDCGGIIIDLKHHIGGSSIPHGRQTAISRDALWNRLWADRAQQPRADVLIRSHVHYYMQGDDDDLGWRAITPALQTCGSKYGARRCSGTVSYGFLVGDFWRKGAHREHDIRPVKAKLHADIATAIEV